MVILIIKRSKSHGYFNYIKKVMFLLPPPTIDGMNASFTYISELFTREDFERKEESDDNLRELKIDMILN